MRGPKYFRPDSLEMAVGLREDFGGGARYLAGAVSLVPEARARGRWPSSLISLSGIESLRSITVEAQQIELGSMATHCSLARSTSVAAQFPDLVQMFRSIGSVQIRNCATLGGNICSSDNGHFDPPVALMALGASLNFTGADRAARQVPIGAFLEERLCEHQLCTAVTLPCRASGEGFGYLSLYRRLGRAHAIRVAVWVKITDGHIEVVRIACSWPWIASARRAPVVESALVGCDAFNEPCLKEMCRVGAFEMLPNHSGDLPRSGLSIAVWLSLRRALADTQRDRTRPHSRSMN